MAFSTGSSAGISSEINVTPLIDVLLVLLIIFMVITPVMSRGMPSSIPQGKASDAESAPVLVRVMAGADSAGGSLPRYFVNEREMAPGDVEWELREMLARRPGRAVFVQADRSLSFQQIALVVSEARSAGGTAIALGGRPLR